MKRYGANDTKELLANVEREVARQDEDLRAALRDADVELQRLQSVLEFSPGKCLTIQWYGVIRA